MSKKYTQDRLEKALFDVAHGMAYRTAAKKYDVPRTTLKYKFEGKIKKSTKGPETNFPAEYEDMLVRWIKSCKGLGFPVSKEQLLVSAEKLISESGLTTRFKSNRPGIKWVRLFMKRHPDIAIRMSQNITTVRYKVKKEDLEKWFGEVQKYIHDNNIGEIFNNPTRIYNCDETAFFMSPKGKKVLSCKGDKTVYSVSGNDEKENLTVLFGGNAAGTIIPPMIIFKYDRIPSNIAASIPADWGVGKSESGWMCGNTFYEYVTNIFNPWLNKNGIEKPIALFIDGHTSHLTYHLSKYCSENGIIIIALPPNATHIIQPMDVAVFHVLKLKWKDAVFNWRMEHNGEKIRKDCFAPILNKIIHELKSETIINGFRACGLFPFDVNNLAFDFNIHENTAEAVCDTPSNTTNSIKNIKSLIDLLENKMGNEKLNSFRNKRFPIEDSSLYEIWTELRKEIKSDEDDDAEISKISESEDCVPFPSETRGSEQCGITETSVSATGDEQHIAKTSTTVECTSKTGEPTIPSPFKRALFWPEPVVKKCNKKIKEKIPSVITSEAWQNYHVNKEKKKLEIETKKAEMRKKREEKRSAIEARKKTVKRRKKQQSSTAVSSDSESESERQMSEKSSGVSDNEDAQCLYCTGLYSNDQHGESWIQCIHCRLWAHEYCDGRQLGPNFVCVKCRSF